MATEVCQDDVYSFEVDVFSFGMILYEFYSGDRPRISGKVPFHVIRNTLRGERPDVSKLLGGPIYELIEKCWSGDPKKRPSFNEIIFEFIVNREKYWPDDVDDGEVDDYLAKFGLSLDSGKESIYAKFEFENKKDDDDDEICVDGFNFMWEDSQIYLPQKSFDSKLPINVCFRLIFEFKNRLFLWHLMKLKCL